MRRTNKLWSRLGVSVAVLALLCSVIPGRGVAQKVDAREVYSEPWVVIEPGPVRTSTNWRDGSVVELQTTITWKPILEIQPPGVSVEVFENYIREKSRRRDERPGGGGSFPTPEASKGLNLFFWTDASVPSEAFTAIGEVEDYLEALFDDPITVEIHIDFDPNMPGGTLGSTGVSSTSDSYDDIRSNLVADMDGDDFIQDYLPSMTLPVRYNGSSSTVTDEDQCEVAWANWGAIGHSISGAAAWISMNANLNWDYDPSNGVMGYCFQSVLTHEVGHALGFLSRAEQWYEPNSDIYLMDIFRFQRTDGSGDYNPDEIAEFETAPRLVDYNNPDDQHISNLFYSDGYDVEYRMSDGTPYQASHFRSTVWAAMNPALSMGQTFYPDYYRTPDLVMFDVIGWDYGLPGPPVADFRADTTHGLSPLTVQFTDRSSGLVDSWHWWFGDGDEGYDANPQHVYDECGHYDVTLAVCGPSGCDTVTKNSYIWAWVDTIEAQNTYAYPGQTCKTIKVKGVWCDSLAGYGFAAYFDTAFLMVDTVTLEGTAGEGASISVGGVDSVGGSVSWGVVYGFTPPWIPAGADYLFNVKVHVNPGLAIPSTTWFDLENGIGLANNSFTVWTNDDVYPALVDGRIIVTELAFIRADADADMDVEMSDAIFTLKYLYIPGAEEPPCMKSADSDDTGVVEMADVIYTLKHLYVPGSPPPPAPGPSTCGPDPTEDGLDCCDHPCWNPDLPGAKGTESMR